MTSRNSRPGSHRFAPRPGRSTNPCALALAAGIACAGAAQAQHDAPAQQIVIVGSGVEQRAFDTPYAVGVVDAETLRTAGPMVNLSESLSRIPGLIVNSRQNYAQDLQISSRGFGARAAFGVRGIRLVSDGVPASTPDGQGQVAHFDLAGAHHIEVLRGPFSALYGNSSGGVIALVSARPERPEAQAGVDLGSDGLRQWRASVAAPLDGGFDLRASASGFATDGLRPHSAATRRLANLRLGYEGAADRVTLQASWHEQPADDPLGLTREQFDANPRRTAAQATAFDTRKTVAQHQLGAQWRHRFAAPGGLVPNESALSAYVGSRGVTQWLAIASATQANPRHPGGVVDFDRQYHGADLRWLWRWPLAGERSAELVVGWALDEQSEDRRGFENFTGNGAGQQLGVTGRLRRDEANRARSNDVYAQARYDIAAAWVATLGPRSGRLDVRTRDAYLSNGDDSGALRYRYTVPVAALQWRAMPDLNLLLSAGRGFESPTLTELAYRPDGSAGFNDALRPQRSRQLELGAKWRHGSTLSIDAALFRADTRDEIGIATNAGGRSTFANVGRTRREGAEVAARWQIAPAWRAAAAVTWLDAVYRDDFLTCAGIPCTAPTVPVAAGNRIAGTVRNSGLAEFAWRVAPPTEFGAELRAQGGMVVNDLNSDATEGVWIGALRASHKITLGRGQLDLLARIDNVSDRRYAGSVIVGDANGRFFEPAPGRQWLLGATWRQGW